MKMGIYKVALPERGECARVRWLAGDGAPYLERRIYEAVRFEPPFDELPGDNEYHAGPQLPDTGSSGRNCAVSSTTD